MATKELEKLAAEDKHCERERLKLKIRQQVLRCLGQPDDFRAVDVRPLWATCYRANVLVGQDASSIQIAHSYFLEADSDGSIIRSDPPITRMYGTQTINANSIATPSAQTGDNKP
jgi:hypothetical protein